MAQILARVVNDHSSAKRLVDMAARWLPLRHHVCCLIFAARHRDRSLLLLAAPSLRQLGCLARVRDGAALPLRVSVYAIALVAPGLLFAPVPEKSAHWT